MRFERMTYRLEGGCSIQLSYQGLMLTFLYYHEHFLLQEDIKIAFRNQYLAPDKF